MPWWSLERTHETTIKSFSRPWNASTLATSTSSYSSLRWDPLKRMYWTTYARWPSYGVITPICSGLMPERSRRVMIFSTLAASVLQVHNSILTAKPV